MTPAEFKSWFAVFCEAIDGTPTPTQWARIKAKVEELGRTEADSAQAKRDYQDACDWFKRGGSGGSGIPNQTLPKQGPTDSPLIGRMLHNYIERDHVERI